MSRSRRFGLSALSLAAVIFSLAARPVPVGTVDPPTRPAGAPSGPLTVYALVNISDVNANSANGRALLGEFSEVTIRGIAQTGIGQLDPRDVSNPSVWFYVSDATGTVAVSKGSGTSGLPSVAAGDSVEVTTYVLTQSLAPLRGTRSVDVDAIGIGTITVRSSGHPLDVPAPTPASAIATGGNAIEGRLVTVSGLSVVAPGEWPTAGNSGFVRVTDGTDTLRLYVDNDTDLDSISPPTGAFDLTGFVAQNQTNPSSSWLFDHFLYPRSVADIVQGDGDGTAAVSPGVVTEGDTNRTLTFSLAGVQAALTAVELDIPASWTWTDSTDITTSGLGFAGAQVPVATAQGGGWMIRVDDTSLSAASTGTITIGSLNAPNAVEASEFTTRTSAGGPVAEILEQPVVLVVSAAQPGDVVINEVLPSTRTGTQGTEGGEFIELHNPGSSDFVIGGWTLSDIGRRDACTLDARWAFPTGATIPAGGYAVVCRNARDASNPNSPRGFLVDFPSFPSGVPLFEIYDAVSPSGSRDVDDPATPNMVLMDPTSGDDQIALLGGPVTNGGQCASTLLPFEVPFEEAVVLRNALGAVIDGVRYREPGPCTEDLCDGSQFGDVRAYPFGHPKPFHSLGRDALSTDTNDSSADLRPASTATPGRVNTPGDTAAPAIVETSLVTASGSILDIHFDEVVDNATATDPANYTVTVAESRAPVTIVAIVPDPVDLYRHYVILTEPMSAGATGTIVVSGVTDLAFVGDPADTLAGSLPFSVPADAFTICEIQAFDERGFSPKDGELVTVAGYVTILPTSSSRYSIWVQEPGETGCGVNVFSFDTPAEAAFYGTRLNDLVQIRGRVTEFVSSSSGSGAVTELAAVDAAPFFAFIARGLEGPAPRVVRTVEANDEALEGTLVKTSGTVINANSLAAYIDDGSGSIQIFQNFSSLDLTRFTVGDRLEVTGVITQFDSTDPFFSGYELVPQSQESLVPLDGGFARGGRPEIDIPRGVLVPSLGEELTITVTTPRRADVIVEIYDVVGRKVITLYDGIGLGEMIFDWDGSGQDGSMVEPGAYMCHVRAVPLDGGSVETRTTPIVVGMRLK